MFECGTLKCHVENIKMNQGLGEEYEIPVPWFLIEHPRGTRRDRRRQRRRVRRGSARPLGRDLRRVLAGDDARAGVRPGDEGGRLRSRRRALRAAVAPAPRPHRRARRDRPVPERRGDRDPRPSTSTRHAPDWFAAGGYIQKPTSTSRASPGHCSRTPRTATTCSVTARSAAGARPATPPATSPSRSRCRNSGAMLLTVDAAYTTDHWEEKALPGFLASVVDTVRSVRKLHRIAAPQRRDGGYRPRP